MFHSAALRLSALYLAIIMAISLFFSFGLYRVSTGAIQSGLKSQVDQIERLQRPLGRRLIDESVLRELYDEKLAASTRSLESRLLWTNLGILVIGGLASYWLARRSLEPIEKSHEAQSRFASDASHELRTPLAVMKSEIEVALRGKKLTLAQAKELLNSNLEELAKLTALSSGLLQLARSQDKGIEKQPVSSAEIIQEAVDRLGAAAKSKKIKLQLPQESVRLSGDKPSLVELVAILLDNAIKYSKAGDTVIIAAAKRGAAASISVTDQGSGIPPQDIPHIFERFYRSPGQKQEGHGLGLAIAKTIADAHGGTLSVVSDLGKGSTFSVELPAT